MFDAINQARKNLLNIRNEVNKVKRRQEEVLSNVEKTEYRGMRKMVQTEIDQLKERLISSLNKRQISLLKESLERSSTSLLTKFSNLMKIAKNENEIDMQRTISNSLQTFGVPMELVFRTAKKKKTKIDIIQDVSGSVIKSAEFLSLFVFLIHKQFSG